MRDPISRSKGQKTFVSSGAHLALAASPMSTFCSGQLLVLLRFLVKMASVSLLDVRTVSAASAAAAVPAIAGSAVPVAVLLRRPEPPVRHDLGVLALKESLRIS